MDRRLDISGSYNTPISSGAFLKAWRSINSSKVIISGVVSELCLQNMPEKGVLLRRRPSADGLNTKGCDKSLLEYIVD